MYALINSLDDKLSNEFSEKFEKFTTNNYENIIETLANIYEMAK